MKNIYNNLYKYGFFTNLLSLKSKIGLNFNIIKYISSIKKEPFWMLNKRLRSYKYWISMKYPLWSNLIYPRINFQDIYFFSSPLYINTNILIQLDIFSTYKKLGILFSEYFNNMAIDIIFDSLSIITTYKKELLKYGILFSSISSAIIDHSYLIRQYFSSVVLYHDNFFATLNCSVFSDGTFVYIPKYTKCPIELSTYFRINESKIGQFERTLIIADDYSYISYIEGCTASQQQSNQLHAAVVEIIALRYSIVKYSTLQNWYPGTIYGQGGILNFVTKRGLCLGLHSQISWIQFETGSSITWKYPSCILKGNYSYGNFYSISFSNYWQQIDTGTKMIHIGHNTSSSIMSKSISSGCSRSTYRGLVKILFSAFNSKNYTQCDSLLISLKSSVFTLPYIYIYNHSSILEHEATVSSINATQLLYCSFRSLSYEDSVLLIVSGFCTDILNYLPMEFSIEAKMILDLNLGKHIA